MSSSSEGDVTISCVGHIVRRPSWATIDLDTQTGAIFVQEDWRYIWLVDPGARPWTLSERRRFHNTADRQIWGTWSGRVRLRTSGTHHLATPPRDLRVSFDIRWVLRAGHWTVNVRKVPPGTDSPRSWVDFAAQTIHLDNLDGVPHAVGNDASQSRDGFYTIPHELGHTLPSRGGSATPIPDEYNAGHAHLADTDSLMNIGRNVRGRHVQALIDELNGMLPDLQFSAAP